MTAHTDVEHLQLRIQELEAQLLEARQRFDLLLSASGQVVYDYDVNTGDILWDGAITKVLGFSLQEMEGGIARWSELIHDDDAQDTFRRLEDAERTCSSFAIEYRFGRKDGNYVWMFDRGFFLPGSDGKAQRMIGIMQDISERKWNEIERATMQEQIIKAQQEALRELSSPLIPISDSVVVMPLIGSIDSRRAQDVMEGLLRGIEAQKARTAILDITGVPVVDTQVANALLQAAQAARLLGAKVIITGIRPEVAQTLVGLGVELGSIITQATLQSGITYALRRGL
jgi:rsbT co-antagonist protein RsbR